MKKAAELATLCGVKVGLVFTDLYNSVHYFSNDNGIKVDFSDACKAKKDTSATYTYSLADVIL